MARWDWSGPIRPIPSDVGVVDNPASRLRYPSDLLGAISCAVGVIVVCVLVIYAHNTAAGVAEDVRAFSGLLQRLLFVPVTFLEIVVVLFPPVAVSLEQVIRRHASLVPQTLAAGLGGVIVNAGLYFLLARFASAELLSGLSIHQHGDSVLTLPGQVAAIAALLTAAAEPTRRRTITWSWTLLWITVGVLVITSAASLPGMGLSLLVGAMVGLVVRYIAGMPSERAYGDSLIEGVRRAGFEPVSLDRTALLRDGGLAAGQQVGRRAPQFFADHRLYAMRTVTGRIYDVIVLDGDRQVIGRLARWWRQLRSRAVDSRSIRSLRQAAERAALLTYAVRAAGVRTPSLLAMSEADDSMLLIREQTPTSVCLTDLAPAEVDDGLVRAMWSELHKAHRAGIVHRGLISDAFLVQTDDQGAQRLWILGWEAGDVASSELAQSIDLAQLLALLALKVGPERAIASAVEALSQDELRALSTVLQTPALPRQTREQIRADKNLLNDLRQRLVQGFPADEVEPQQLVRVGARTLISVVLAAAAVIVILTTFNLPEVGEALAASDWRWALASFGLGLVGVVGASLILVAFAPVKVGLGLSCQVQLAASFVAVAAPAGLGTAAINFRALSKRGVNSTLATATAALIQVSQITITVLALVALTLATGSNQAAPFQVTPAMLVVVVVLALVVGAMFALPRTRGWILNRITPILKRTWPRLVELFSNPGRLALGLGGNLVMLLGYAASFQAALMAFGQDVPFLSSAIVYLIGNSAGSAAPTPGGMGAIEIAESAALVSAGVNAGVAASVVVIFRVATYWIRIPLGWLAMRHLEKQGHL
ncbi:MAG: flippase-like domain-containing protein [Propionibacteriaceae bacterium]|nr:flippase-like domain-containing protein [Propionibacteriaceae bacterium]